MKLSPLESKVWRAIIATDGRWMSKSRLFMLFKGKEDHALSGLIAKKLVSRETRDGVVGVKAN